MKWKLQQEWFEMFSLNEIITLKGYSGDKKCFTNTRTIGEDKFKIMNILKVFEVINNA